MSGTSAPPLLEVEATSRLELNELSAVCWRAGADPDAELVGVSDSEYRIAIGGADPAMSRSVSADLRTAVAEWTYDATGGSQWEGVAADGDGRVVVLQEHSGKRKRPPHVFVFSPSLERREATIALRVENADGGWARKWGADKNARAEALVLMHRGHVLVVKQKDPVRLIEFGPGDDQPLGLDGAGFLSAPDAFEQPAEDFTAYRPLASWGVSRKDRSKLESVNDAAVVDGAIFVVSRTSRVIARLESPDHSSDEPVRVARRWRIPDAISYPEGLAIRQDLTPVVADDVPVTGERPPNLSTLSPLQSP